MKKSEPEAESSGPKVKSNGPKVKSRPPSKDLIAADNELKFPIPVECISKMRLKRQRIIENDYFSTLDVIKRWQKKRN